MKKLLLIFTLLFSTLMFSTPSYGEWTKVAGNADGTTFYVDLDRIRKHSGYVYYWDLTDRSKPQNGTLSSKVYVEADCKLFRFNPLSFSFHKEPMGRGTSELVSPPTKKVWQYPPPNSVAESTLNKVCSQ